MGKNANEKVKKSFGISKENNSAVKKAVQKATREALKMHKQAENPIAVWQDGKIIILSPDKISA